MGEYFDTVLSGENRDNAVEDCLDAIRTMPTPPEFVAVRGLSGAVIGSLVADRLGLPLVVVRKNCELSPNSHTSNRLAGARDELDGRGYVIVDDFVASGSTVDSIVAGIRCKLRRAEPLGVVCYKSPDDARKAGMYDVPCIPSPRGVERVKAERAEQRRNAIACKMDAVRQGGLSLPALQDWLRFAMVSASEAYAIDPEIAARVLQDPERLTDEQEKILNGWHLTSA